MYFDKTIAALFGIFSGIIAAQTDVVVEPDLFEKGFRSSRSVESSWIPQSHLSFNNSPFNLDANSSSQPFYPESKTSEIEYTDQETFTECRRDISELEYLDINQAAGVVSPRAACSSMDENASEQGDESTLLTPSFLIKITSTENGKIYLVVVTVDRQGRAQIRYVYAGNNFQTEWLSDEFRVDSDESEGLTLWTLGREENQVSIRKTVLSEDLFRRLSFGESGTFHVFIRNNELMIIDQQGHPQILDLPILKRPGAAFGVFGYSFVRADKPVAKLAKKGVDRRGVVSTDYSSRAEFERFSRLAEIMNKLVRLFHLRHQFQGFYEDIQQREAVKKSLQKINMLAGRAISLLLPTTALYIRLDDLLGTGAPAYRNASLEISADNLAFMLMDYEKDDHWPEYMMLFFTLTDMGGGGGCR